MSIEQQSLRAIVLDALVGDITLSEHDDIYHPNGYKKGDQCLFREKLELEAQAQELSPEQVALRDRWGLHREENEGISSYTTRAEKDAKGKWREIRADKKGKSLVNKHDAWIAKKKGDKWRSLPNAPEGTVEENFPNFASFSGAEIVEKKAIKDMSPDEYYHRGDRIEGASSDEAQYKWTIGGEEVSPSTALRLERAMKERAWGATLNPKMQDVKIRRDRFGGEGEVISYTNADGKCSTAYDPHSVELASIAKWLHAQKMLPHYDRIKEKIASDCESGNPTAMLAYAMMRTKIRVGSQSVMGRTEGKGLRHLTRGDVQLSPDGETLNFSFNGKAKQWWHLTVKDKKLYDYIKKRKEEIDAAAEGGKKVKLQGARGVSLNPNAVPLFDTSYNKISSYLKDVSTSLGIGESLYPHDFRRLGANRVVSATLKRLLAGIDPVKERKKYEDRVHQAVISAAQTLNDTPDVVWSSYIAPQILFADTPEDAIKYHPLLKHTRV